MSGITNYTADGRKGNRRLVVKYVHPPYSTSSEYVKERVFLHTLSSPGVSEPLFFQLGPHPAPGSGFILKEFLPLSSSSPPDSSRNAISSFVSLCAHLPPSPYRILSYGPRDILFGTSLYWFGGCQLLARRSSGSRISSRTRSHLRVLCCRECSECQSNRNDDIPWGINIPPVCWE